MTSSSYVVTHFNFCCSRSSTIQSATKSLVIYLFRYKLPHFDCLGISRFFKGPPSLQFPVAVNLHSRILPDHVTFSHVMSCHVIPSVSVYTLVCHGKLSVTLPPNPTPCVEEGCYSSLSLSVGGMRRNLALCLHLKASSERLFR